MSLESAGSRGGEGWIVVAGWMGVGALLGRTVDGTAGVCGMGIGVEVVVAGVR